MKIKDEEINEKARNVRRRVAAPFLFTFFFS